MRHSSGKALTSRRATTQRSSKRCICKGVDARMYGKPGSNDDEAEALRAQMSQNCKDWVIFPFDRPREPMKILPHRPDQAVSLVIHLLTGETDFDRDWHSEEHRIPHWYGTYQLQYGHVFDHAMVRMTRDVGGFSFFCHPNVVSHVQEFIAKNGTKNVPFFPAKSPLIIDQTPFTVTSGDGVPKVTPEKVHAVPKATLYEEEETIKVDMRADSSRPAATITTKKNVEKIMVMYSVKCDKKPEIHEGTCELKFTIPNINVDSVVTRVRPNGNETQGDTGTSSDFYKHTIKIAGETWTLENSLNKKEMMKRVQERSYISVPCEVEPSNAKLYSTGTGNPKVSSEEPFTLTAQTTGIRIVTTFY